MEAIKHTIANYCISHNICSNRDCLRKPTLLEISKMGRQHDGRYYKWGDYHNPRFGIKCEYFREVDR